MKLYFDGQYQMNPQELIRRCGYGQHRGRQISYAKRVSVGQFPRFHAYIDTVEDGFTINLHLDQKAACYGGTTAHSGEYDGELVEREAERIRSAIEELRA